MPCYRPVDAWQNAPGEPVTFRDFGGRKLLLPCGRCIGCRIKRVEDWTVRLMHESQMHEFKCFITLTYADMPTSHSLEYPDFQKFLKRLRKRAKVRFFCAGEYGSQNLRPHWHAILYGVDFVQIDGKVISNKGGFRLYESESLNNLWPMGFASVGSLTPASAAYVAKYCVDKRTGPLAESHYRRLNLATGEVWSVAPESARMSLSPAIGMPWYRKYAEDLHRHDHAVLCDGRVKSVPRFYMKKLGEVDPVRHDAIQYARYLDSQDCDDSPERLAAREACAKARVDFYKRNSL